MLKYQADRLKPQFEQAGFVDMVVDWERHVAHDEIGEPPVDRGGWVLRGRGHIRGSRGKAAFSLRSKRRAVDFLLAFGPEQKIGAPS